METLLQSWRLLVLPSGCFLLQFLWATPSNSYLSFPLMSVQAGALWFATKNLTIHSLIYLSSLICNYSPFWILCIRQAYFSFSHEKTFCCQLFAHSWVFLFLSKMPFSLALFFFFKTRFKSYFLCKVCLDSNTNYFGTFIITSVSIFNLGTNHIRLYTISSVILKDCLNF